MSDALESDDLVDVSFEWAIGGKMVPDQLIEECSMLYSKHYGKWGASASKPGESISLSTKRVKLWLESESSGVYYAKCKGDLIGYAIAVIAQNHKKENIAWVTQLVVHEDYRNKSVAKRILYRIWGQSSFKAWGIVSANPFAIRALEKATRRRCDPSFIKDHYKDLLRFGAQYIPYISPELTAKCNLWESSINTDFHIDHAEVPVMLEKATGKGAKWCLGDLDEGWEWFAFTFHEQNQFGLNTAEIEDMLNASDEITRIAYSKMAFDKSHAWMKSSKPEIDYVVSELNLNLNSVGLDIGCGIGRHTLELAGRGIRCTGIDYSETLISRAIESAGKNSLADFKCFDCRDFVDDSDVPWVVKGIDKYDFVLCLYDVVGSFVDNDSNRKILDVIFAALKDGGKAIISVMNYEHRSTFRDAKKFSFASDPSRVLKIPASNTMQKTGNVFNSEHMIVDPDTRIVYRREIFAEGYNLPQEWIVRDRRFTLDELIGFCASAGLRVCKSMYVNSGSWSLSNDRNLAKEILVVCEKYESTQIDFLGALV